MQIQKNYNHLMYDIAVFFAGIFLIFLDDLANFGRVGKHDPLWWRACYHLEGNAQLVCMANYDMLVIFISLGILMYLVYKLVPVYKKWVFMIPVLGFIVFVIGWPILTMIMY